MYRPAAPVILVHVADSWKTALSVVRITVAVGMAVPTQASLLRITLPLCPTPLPKPEDPLCYGLIKNGVYVDVPLISGWS